MDTQLCPFGPFLVTLRKKTKIPQWLLAARTEVTPANLRKIERGFTKPGVMLALRLLRAVTHDVGTKIQLFCSQQEISPRSPQYIPDTIPKSDCLPHFRNTTNGSVCLFGLWLKEVRLAYHVPQKQIAELAGYHLRNMYEVEHGRREPSVTTALELVCGIGCDIAWFFDCLNNVDKTNAD